MLWDYPSDLPLAVTDRGKVKTVLLNLINNAIKFTERGRVTVSARMREANIFERFLEFKVADTGTGISKEELANIFTSFRQLQMHEVSSWTGTGLGLYIVKAFTDLLGGQTEIDSQPGKGTAFKIIIPCPREERKTPYEEEDSDCG
jgi:two-component system sensor histidine kinase/response regulator